LTLIITLLLATKALAGDGKLALELRRDTMKAIGRVEYGPDTVAAAQDLAQKPIVHKVGE
jgi:hypothetical protein